MRIWLHRFARFSAALCHCQCSLQKHLRAQGVCNRCLGSLYWHADPKNAGYLSFPYLFILFRPFSLSSRCSHWDHWVEKKNSLICLKLLRFRCLRCAKYDWANVAQASIFTAQSCHQTYSLYSIPTCMESILERFLMLPECLHRALRVLVAHAVPSFRESLRFRNKINEYKLKQLNPIGNRSHCIESLPVSIFEVLHQRPQATPCSLKVGQADARDANACARHGLWQRLSQECLQFLPKTYLNILLLMA